uniref:Uncharacterized protein n=1 Tax=Romanomermis culicivorax TaxID=13658 RepID=A0A915JIS8_ROMCU
MSRINVKTAAEKISNGQEIRLLTSAIIAAELKNKLAKHKLLLGALATRQEKKQGKGFMK